MAPHPVLANLVKGENRSRFERADNRSKKEY